MAADSRAKKLTITRNPPTSITAWHWICEAEDLDTSPPTPFSVDGDLTNVADAESDTTVQAAVAAAVTAAGFDAINWTL